MQMKLAVTSYSYNLSYMKYKMDIYDCMKAAHDLGVEGFEIVSELTPAGHHPSYTEAELDKWHENLNKYKLKATCYDSCYIPISYRNRINCYEEQMRELEAEFKLASKMGFSVMRLYPAIDIGIIAETFAMADYYGVAPCIEIHVPMTIRSRSVEGYINLIEKKGSKLAGIIPDFGVYGITPDPTLVPFVLHDGVSQALVDDIYKAYAAGQMKQVVAEYKGKDIPESLRAFIERSASLANDNPEDMKLYGKYIRHVHAKFYHVDDNLRDTSIDTENAMRVLREIGYTGYVASEYEGQRDYSMQGYSNLPDPDEIEQVARHITMLRPML